MNRTVIYLIGVLAAVIVGQVQADTVAGLTTFTAGTPARAEDVNNNFNVVKSAVDNNDGRITVNAVDLQNKQSRVSGTCAAGSSIRTINSDGSVVCEQKTKVSAGAGIDVSGNTISMAGGSVTVPAVAFKLTNVYGCGTAIGPVGGYVHVYNGLNCGYVNGAALIALVRIPQGMIITQFKCSLYDYSTDGSIDTIILSRQPIDSVAHTEVATISGGSADNTDFQTLSSNVVNHVVDNTMASYVITMILHNSGTDFSVIGSDLGVGGCSVLYHP